MTRIGAKKFRQHADRYLKRVASGDVLEVTRGGKLVALVVPPTPTVASRQRLIASGRLIAATGTLHIPTHRYATGRRIGASQALAELREDRLT